MAEVPPDADLVVVRPATIEIDKIKGSRFIADIGPAESAEAATSFLTSIRNREPAASHHCWAYRIPPRDIRSSDDGEPGGTAGPPILRRLESAGLWKTVIVVTRYYGGTNLGTGGLIRAYGEAAAVAIARAVTARLPRMTTFRISHPYEASATIQRVLATHGANITESSYSDVVDLTVSVPESQSRDFAEDLRDATAGSVTPRPQ